MFGPERFAYMHTADEKLTAVVKSKRNRLFAASNRNRLVADPSWVTKVDGTSDVEELVGDESFADT